MLERSRCRGGDGDGDAELPLGSQAGFPFATAPWGGSREEGNAVLAVLMPKLRARRLLPR